MNMTWMMWVNGDKGKSPRESVLEAVEYYREKYGVRPNKVRAYLAFPDVDIEGVILERDQIVLKDRLHLTLDTKTTTQQEGKKNAQ